MLPGVAKFAEGATRTWTGGGPSNNWSNAANWGGTVPFNGDDLVFGGTTRLTTNNDIAGSEIFQKTGKYVSSLPWAKYSTLGSNTLTATGVTVLGDFTGISNADPIVTISANPSLIVCQNASLTLVANPAGDPNFTYLWSLAGANTQSINPSTALAGTTVYSVTITDGNGFTATANVTVTVYLLPTAPTPGSNSRCGPGTVTISATPGTSETIDWYDASSGGTLLLSGNVSYTTPSISANTIYYAGASANGCVSATRTAVTAIVNTPPMINKIPDQTDCKGNVVDFTAAYSVVGSVNYQWQSSTNGGASWNNIPGSSGSSNSSPIILSLSNIGVSGLNVNQTRYQLIINDGNGCTATSNSAILTVNSITAITGITTSTLCEGQSISFTASTAGVSPNSYQWIKHTSSGVWSDVPGETTQTLSFTNISIADAGEYTVRVIFPITIPNNNGSTTCTETNYNITRRIIVNPLSTAIPGGPDFICQSANPSAITLTGASVGGSATTGAWSITSLNPDIGVKGNLSSTAPTASPETVTYTPPTNYVGTATLTLTTNDPAGPCSGTSAIRTFFINSLPASSPIYHR